MLDLETSFASGATKRDFNTALRTDCARQAQPSQPTTARRRINSWQSSVGPRSRWRKYTRAPQIKNAWQRPQCTCWKRRNKTALNRVPPHRRVGHFRKNPETNQRENCVVVPVEGIEPPCLAAHDFESCAS